MKPDSTDTNELLRRVRQQLILAQVRIMDLEDERDALTSQLGETEKRQTAAQSLADEKSDLSRNLKVSIEDCSSQLTETTQHIAQLERDLEALTDKSVSQHKELETLGNTLSETRSLNERLDSEIVALKHSRSWRWTAWLRSLRL